MEKGMIQFCLQSNEDKFNSKIINNCQLQMCVDTFKTLSLKQI